METESLLTKVVAADNLYKTSVLRVTESDTAVVHRHLQAERPQLFQPLQSMVLNLF